MKETKRGLHKEDNDRKPKKGGRKKTLESGEKNLPVSVNVEKNED